MLSSLLLASALSVSDPGIAFSLEAGGAGDDRFEGIASMPGGDIVAVGTRTGEDGSIDGWAVMVDGDDGGVIWQKACGGPGEDEFLDVAVLGDSILAVGSTTRNGESDLWAVLFDGDGEVLGETTLGGGFEDAATSVAALPRGGAVLAGYTWSEGEGGCDMWLVKMDGTLDVEWTRTFGGQAQDKAYCVAALDSTGIVAGGMTYSFDSGGGDACLVEYDLWGMRRWAGHWGGPGYDFAMAVSPGPADGCTAACWSRRQMCAVWLISVDRLGTMADERLCESLADLRVESLAPAEGGGWALAGTAEDPASGEESIFAWLLDDSFGGLWTASFGEGEEASCRDLAVMPGGALALCGSMETAESAEQGLIIRTSPRAPGTPGE
jgi:hypothetical protein